MSDTAPDGPDASGPDAPGLDALGGEPPVLGVVGGGQLGRMLAEAAAPLGVAVVVLDPTPDCPAATVADDQVVGDFDDPDAVARLAERADVLTVEIELADPDLLARVREEYGVPVHPDPESVRVARDKLVEKRALADAGIPVPDFRAVDGPDDLRAALEDLGAPLMLKARRGGYDGRGNAPVERVADAEAAFDDLEGFVAERMVDFERELSAIGVRGAGDAPPSGGDGDATADGDGAVLDAFPVVENVHRAEILRETVAPARTAPAVRERARETVLDVLGVLSGRGVFGVELFETADGQILVNEIAPRPHNSGHYTIEGADTSQFAQHVRAVLGAPLGSSDLRAPAAMANVLGDVDEPVPARLTGAHGVLAAPRAALHWYGKREARPLRKMGHLTAVAAPDEGEDAADALERVTTLRDGLTFQ
ncbi:MAG: 5-(carboxyamino)imidazole ribonucleotide synthase [Halobacteriaceae archaeon]